MPILSEEESYVARILLVDDDHQLLEVAAALLTHVQHEVLCCENAVDALELARRELFDVVITDANMHPHSGFDLVRSLKLIPDYDLVPVAMLTGRRERRDVERALSVGVQDYFVKPLDPDHFIKKVAELVARGESQQRTARFAQVELDEVATCQMPLVVIGLTEKGVLLDSDHHLHTDSTITLDCDLFNRIGIPKAQLRVVRSSPGKIEGTFEVRTSFEGLSEKDLLKVRQYIQTRTQQLKRSKAA